MSIIARRTPATFNAPADMQTKDGAAVDGETTTMLRFSRSIIARFYQPRGEVEDATLS